MEAELYQYKSQKEEHFVPLSADNLMFFAMG